ncbi:DUF397 domain-containing protein [Actinomadura sp. KC06]|nr:DUF397 domain-containing protein [Actinomadura sp. KC06]
MRGLLSGEVIKWRKSRRSDDQGGACMEVARFPDAVAVRDSKDPNGPDSC